MLSGIIVLGGCESTIYRLRVPLAEAPVLRAPANLARVTIEDMRPMAERRPHLGKEIMTCERWFGDGTTVPSKLAYLRSRVADRTRADMQVHVRLTRFDIVEYCEFVPNGNATGAARTAGGSVPGFTPAPATGDTVVIRLAGDANGVPFDLSSRFDYGKMYRFPDVPSSSQTYRDQLRGRLDGLVDQIANSVWRSELAGKATRLP